MSSFDEIETDIAELKRYHDYQFGLPHAEKCVSGNRCALSAILITVASAS